MNGQISNQQEPFIANELKVAFYNATLLEITRYRDREWAIPGLFIAAMVTIIGFTINHPEISLGQLILINVFLCLLAIGNTYYSLITHKKLAKQRYIRNQFEEENHIREYKEKLSPKDEKKNNYDFQSERTNGFWDHILPFITVGWLLYVFGTWFFFELKLICIIHMILKLFFFAIIF